MDLEQTAKLLEDLALEYPEFRAPKERAQNWWRKLLKYSDGEVRAAINAIYREEYRSKTKPPNINEIVIQLGKSGNSDDEAYRACFANCRKWPAENGNCEIYERPVWSEKDQGWRKKQYTRSATPAVPLPHQVMCEYTRKTGERLKYPMLRRHAIHDGKSWIPKIEYVAFHNPAELETETLRFGGGSMGGAMARASTKTGSEEWFAVLEDLLDRTMVNVKPPRPENPNDPF